MKRSNHERRELIEDIFAPEDPENVLSEEQVLRLVSHAREVRQRRRRWAATTAAVILAGTVSAVMFLPDRSTDSSHAAARISKPSTPPVEKQAAAPVITPPTVERVDDERMMAMLDQTPAALVSWPDGRRSLLLLVANPPRK
jgi:hypothetical protein